MLLPVIVMAHLSTMGPHHQHAAHFQRPWVIKGSWLTSPAVRPLRDAEERVGGPEAARVRLCGV